MMENETMKPGDVFTIAGIERGSKGQMLVDGVNIKTGRKCKPVGLMEMRLMKPVKYKTDEENGFVDFAPEHLPTAMFPRCP